MQICMHCKIIIKVNSIGATKIQNIKLHFDISYECVYGESQTDVLCIWWKFHSPAVAFVCICWGCVPFCVCVCVCVWVPIYMYMFLKFIFCAYLLMFYVTAFYLWWCTYCNILQYLANGGPSFVFILNYDIYKLQIIFFGGEVHVVVICTR